MSSARFEILGKLGEGGMGVVYEAYDREREMKVALKTMRTMEPSTLYHFKREFRAVSDLSHPNIVALYELIAEGSECYFTMEVVRGADILTYVRAGLDRAGAPASGSERRGDGKAIGRGRAGVPGAPGRPPVTPSMLEGMLGTDVRTRPLPIGASSGADTTFASDPLAVFGASGPLPRAEDLVDIDRVRHCFAQLARALHALHRVGLVHRDLKPSNVRVTEGGHTVLMDFGIVALEPKPGQVLAASRTMGTPAYMAPEQARGSPIDAMADWYAFGVMLYEALTGQRPFVGKPIEIMRAKLWRRPTPMGRLVRDLPRDLHTICIRLLAKEPSLRPGAEEVLRTFTDRERAVSRLSIPMRQRVEPEAFVGRREELERLRAAYAEARAGSESWVFISSEPGMGKSALVHHFLARIAGDTLSAGSGGHLEPAFGADERAGDWNHLEPEAGAGPLIVRGRCHERETLAYNAFDGIVDSLSHALLSLPRADVEDMVPDDVDLLARLFPVLHRMPAIQARERNLEVEPRALRHRAALALRTMLARLSRTRPIVIHIDDMHWADGDSWALLSHLNTARSDPDAGARMLLIGSLRTGAGHDASHRDADMDERIRSLAHHARVHHMSLGELSLEDRRRLRETLGEGRGAVSSTVWDEAGGNPLLMVELARFATEAPEEESGRASMDLNHVLFHRVARLPGHPRALLDAVCAAVEPLPLRVLADAIGMGSDTSERALTYLRGRNLVQVYTPGPLERILPYHQRLQETVLAYLADDQRRDLHRRIAQALADWEHANLYALAEHWRFAGESERARDYLIEAAELAYAQLAFDRAAALYREALELAPDGPGARSSDEYRATLERLADTLALAGRSFEAAEIYERAAAQATAEAGIELRRLAAENWLRSGHMEQGIQALSSVLEALGIVYPRSRRRAITTFVARRARSRLRGYRFDERRAEQPSAQALARLDTLYAAATSLGLIDHLRGAVLQTYHLERALELGEEHRVYRALAVESAFLIGKRAGRDADELGDRVLERARQLDDPYLLGIVQMMRGGVHFFTGRPTLAIETLRECDRVTSGLARVVEWERVTAHYLLSLAEIASGDFTGAAHTMEPYIADADRHNDVYARAIFRSIPATWWLLVLDRPDEAERNLTTALDGWPTDDYYAAHYTQEFASTLLALYRGHGAQALEQMTTTMPRVDRLMLTRTPWIRCEAHTLVARAALLAQESGQARKSARVIQRAKLPYTDGVAALLWAALHQQAGRADRARAELERARQCFRDVSATHLLAASEIRLGQLLGSSRGRALIDTGIDALRACGVVAPWRMLEFLAPGFALPSS